MIYTIVPMPNSAIPKVMTKRSNWVSISKQDIKPKNAITGNFLMFRGTLKGLFRFGFLSVTSFLNGQNQTRLNMKLTVLTSTIGFPLSLMLTSQFGVIGLITSILIAEIPSLIIGVYWIRKNYQISIDWSSSIKIVITSAITAVLTYLVVSQLVVASWIQLSIGIIFFVPVFINITLIARVIDKSDINNLREMTKTLGPLQKIITPSLNLIEKIIKTLKL